jgi:hypothetical protein
MLCTYENIKIHASKQVVRQNSRFHIGRMVQWDTKSQNQYNSSYGFHGEVHRMLRVGSTNGNSAYAQRKVLGKQLLLPVNLAAAAVYS